MALTQFRFWLGTLAVSLACSAMGGGLGSLKKKTEENAAEKQPDLPKAQGAPRSDAGTSSFGSGTYPSASTGSGFMGDFWGWLVAVPFSYRTDDPGASMSSDQEGWAEDGSDGRLRPRHQKGQAVMPTLRADLNWQYIDGDNQAIDGRIELGYKAIGFQARFTKYDGIDEDTGEDLTQRINQYYGMLRFGGRWPEAFPGAFEVAFGLGVAHQNGDLSDDSSVALTLPLKYHPTDWLGVEFRPAWYEADYGGIVYNIGDYDLSASLGYRFVQFRAGYRWLWFNSIGQTLDGPYAGASLSF
jgi:hypothetical protein